MTKRRAKKSVNLGRVVVISVGCLVLMGAIFAGIVMAAQARVRQPVRQVIVTTAYPDFTRTATRVPVQSLLKTEAANWTPTSTPGGTTATKRPTLATRTPTLRSLVVTQARVRPGNCATAVAMGLSDGEAGVWPHLDRDGDGVACHGD